MAKFVINGGNKLIGEIEVDSAKNSILPIIAGSILCKEKVVIKKCTKYSDTIKMCDILECLGAKISYDDDTLVLDNTNLHYAYIPSELTRDIRASFFTLGAMLARFKRAKIALPGGCLIGLRGVDMHKKVFQELGVKFTKQHGYIYCEYDEIQKRQIYFDFPSVGVTENAIMFCCANKGNFTLYNCAKEPEIVDLAKFLNSMGACIVGAGTNCIHIKGGETLKGVEYAPIPDRIVAGTLLVAGAITRGDIVLKNCNPKHLLPLIDILQKAGCDIKVESNAIHLQKNCTLQGFGRIDTQVYPGFPTDLQSQITTLACLCCGTTLIKENIFENRFNYVPELIKMGANINVENNLAIVNGVLELFGADVYATDLRGGASLVLAGLVAKGYTTVHDIHYIDRGYFCLERQLTKLNADIHRQE